MIGAVDIGGTKIAAGAVDEAGRVFALQSYPIQSCKDPIYGIRQVVDMLHQVEQEIGSSLEGVGIGITGRVFPGEGRLGKNDFLPAWEGLNLSEELEHNLGVSITVENDADAAALGEWVWGSGQGRRLFVMVTIGTGIGVGVVIDGKLYRGVNGAHPEIGHHVIDPSGPACYCGRNGCWESLASGSALEGWAQANHPQKLYRSAREICQLASNGDGLATGAVKHISGYLELGITNLVNLFAPDLIALGGGLMQSHQLFLSGIQETVNTNCNLVPCRDVKIVASQLGVQAGLVGAAQVWRTTYQEST